MTHVSLSIRRAANADGQFGAYREKLPQFVRPRFRAIDQIKEKAGIAQKPLNDIVELII